MKWNDNEEYPRMSGKRFLIATIVLTCLLCAVITITAPSA